MEGKFPKYIVPDPHLNSNIAYWVIYKDLSFLACYKNGNKIFEKEGGECQEHINSGLLKEVTLEELALIV